LNESISPGGKEPALPPGLLMSGNGWK